VSAVDDHLRLRWQCRRGLLELDLVLNAFLDQAYGDLSPSERAAFRHLLQCSDTDLQNWLFGDQRPDDAELDSIIKKVR
jgi:antitoxin CptB